MQTSLDLTGVKHRTVHVANIEEGMEEDVAQLMAARAGPVERWARASVAMQDSTDMSTVTIVFASLDAVTTALSFDRLPFAGKSLLVWQANKDKPREMLALEYRPPEEDAEAAAEREKRVKEILDQLRTSTTERTDDLKRRGEADVSHAIMSEAERAAFLKQNAYRQAVALRILTAQQNEALEAQRRRLEEEVADVQGYLDGKPRRKVPEADTPIDVSTLQEIGRRRPRGVEPGAPVTAKPVRFDS
jgi:hypothetical protein